MTVTVVDASIVGPLLFEDERADFTAELQHILATGDCIITAHWRLEVANLLLMGIRRGRALIMEVELAFDLLDGLGFIPDTETGVCAWGDTYRLAAKHKLTIYDAAYLELARRTAANLMSFDKRLIEAASSEGISISLRRT